MKLLVDECLHPTVAEMLAAAGHDAESVGGLGLQGSPDEVVMRAAGTTPRRADIGVTGEVVAIASSAAGTFDVTGHRYGRRMTDFSSRMPRVRRAPVPADAMLVIRGEDVDDPSTSIRQAELFARRYVDFGRYGRSAFLARSDDDVRDLGADQLERFSTLLIFAMADVISAGFDVVATFRTPHVTIAFSDAPTEGIARLLELNPRRVANPGFREDG